MNKVLTKSRSVHMRFAPKTIERVGELARLLNSDNKSRIVADAIALYHKIELAKQETGGKVFIEYPNGERDRLVFIKS